MKKILITLILTSLFWYCDRIELKEANSMAQQNINLGSAYGDPSADKRRDAFSKCEANFKELYNNTRKLTLEIGAWNMDATESTSVDISDYYESSWNIIGMSVIIFNDSGNPFGRNIETLAGGYAYIANDYLGNKIVSLNRVESGYFDSPGFDSASINRGFVTIYYNEIVYS